MRATTFAVVLSLALSASAADVSEQHAKRFLGGNPASALSGGCGTQTGAINVAALNTYGCTGNSFANGAGFGGGCGSQNGQLLNVAALNQYNCNQGVGGVTGLLPQGLSFKEAKHDDKA